MKQIKVKMSESWTFVCPPMILVYKTGDEKKIQPVKRGKDKWFHLGGARVNRDWHDKMDEAYAIYINQLIVEEEDVEKSS